MLIVGIGGTTRPDSSSERALRTALDAAAAQGADTRCFAADELRLPLYEPNAGERTPAASALVHAVRVADGIIISSPGYHGSFSGLMKNAVDYIEDLRDASPPYLDGKAIGCIAVAHGWQAAVNTLRAMRDVVHALRGWPVPYGAAVNSAEVAFSGGRWTKPCVEESLQRVAEQCVEFATRLRCPEDFSPPARAC